MDAPFEMKDVWMLLGAKDVEIFLLQKQIALLNEQVQALTEKEEEMKPGEQRKV